MTEAMSGPWEVAAEEVAARVRAGEPPVLLDVRSEAEYRAYHIPGAIHIPIDELAARYGELDPAAPMVVVCEHGIRSSIATDFLRAMGFEACSNMLGGMNAWRGPVEGVVINGTSAGNSSPDWSSKRPR